MRIADFPMIIDIKEEYYRLRQEGNSRDATIELLKRSYATEIAIGVEDDGVLFWIGVADAQYALGKLSESVGHHGLNSLKKLGYMEDQIDSSDVLIRKNIIRLCQC